MPAVMSRPQRSGRVLDSWLECSALSSVWDDPDRFKGSIIKCCSLAAASQDAMVCFDISKITSAALRRIYGAAAQLECSACSGEHLHMASSTVPVACQAINLCYADTVVMCLAMPICILCCTATSGVPRQHVLMSCLRSAQHTAIAHFDLLPAKLYTVWALCLQGPWHLLVWAFWRRKGTPASGAFLRTNQEPAPWKSWLTSWPRATPTAAALRTSGTQRSCSRTAGPCRWALDDPFQLLARCHVVSNTPSVNKRQCPCMTSMHHNGHVILCMCMQ